VNAIRHLTRQTRRTRHLTSIALTALAATMLVLAGTAQAWASRSPLDPPAARLPASVTTPTTSPASAPADGIGAWQVVGIAAICVVVTALTTLLVMRLISGRRHALQSLPA
jgi:hypothetical protein